MRLGNNGCSATLGDHFVSPKIVHSAITEVKRTTVQVPYHTQS